MRKTFVAVGALLAMLPVAAGAHHSFASEYDGTKALSLVGVINKVDQQNPHGFIYLNVPPATPGGHVTNWALETPGPNQLVRNGFTRDLYQDMIDKKEQVTVKAYVARDGAKRAFAETITRADGRTIIKISEGGVTGNVGRAPQSNSVTIDGVAQPEADARGGRGGAPRGGGAPQGAPQGGTRQ
jgi:hypothetical protein